MDPNQQLMSMIQALQPGQEPVDGMAAPSDSIAATQQSALGTSGMHPQDMYSAMMQQPPMPQAPASPY